MFIPLHDHNPIKHLKAQYVTWSLIAVNVVVFVVIQGAGETQAAQTAALLYGMIPALITDVAQLPPGLAVVPDEATLVTYAFLHGSWMHLGGNMLFLWVFGDNVEDAMGHARFLAFYLMCAAAGALVHVAMGPDSQVPLVGASGAVAGVIAAYLMLHPRVKIWILALGRIPLRLPAIWVLGLWVGLQLFNALADTGDNPGEAVAWWAHVGGMAAGTALILFMRRPGVPLFDRGL
ncbi:rhomboid family intramembrane serine protease [Breoghania sp. L-A4]|uniref:rhomboid family intramembrane serine protease n=1 Tax=Breoghania sp. L-A4 TaxID=2304600 RepID=UPI000E35C075|nr:rhomboid family intramembrane serine protease [Breoghania sp. L-A4]AXS38739.1 rhomboid family intramembrane serine protease [Breoghania sp. L-A4]